jgi:hypothetical protein
MSKPDEPDERASSEEKAELRTYRRIASARQRDHIDELAAALLEYTDPARPASGRWAPERKVTVCRVDQPGLVHRDCTSQGGRRNPPPQGRTMDAPAALAPLQMEYRDKFYVVVRSRTSAGWNWSVDVDARTVRGGHAASEAAAIKAAERLIDGVLAPRKRRLTLVRPSGDGGF